MPWHAHLQLDYSRAGARTVLRHRHEGPLRILKSLYPEGDGICHNVIVHPPGGIVGGDTLAVDVDVQPGAHALVSTPGATRFYRSDGPLAAQRVTLRVQAGARLEWLPLETIAYPGCDAHNRVELSLQAGAQCMGWDVCALGLPAAGQPFAQGRLRQTLEWPGVWLERALLDAQDTRLMDSPLGLAGRRALGTLWLASGTPWTREEREALLAAARAALPAPRPLGTAPDAALNTAFDTAFDTALDTGATCPDDRLLVVRALAPLVEPAMAALQATWAALRRQAWGLDAPAPRIWRV